MKTWSTNAWIPRTAWPQPLDIDLDRDEPKKEWSGAYYIVNVRTGAYAALLGDTDRLEVVNIVFNLTETADHGSEVHDHSVTILMDLDQMAVVDYPSRTRPV